MSGEGETLGALSTPRCSGAAMEEVLGSPYLLFEILNRVGADDR